MIIVNFIGRDDLRGGRVGVRPRAAFRFSPRWLSMVGWSPPGAQYIGCGSLALSLRMDPVLDPDRLRAVLIARDIAIRAEMAFEDELIQGLVEGRTHIGVMYTPQSRPGLVVEPLLEEQLVYVTTRTAEILHQRAWQAFASTRFERSRERLGNGLQDLEVIDAARQSDPDDTAQVIHRLQLWRQKGLTSKRRTRLGDPG